MGNNRRDNKIYTEYINGAFKYDLGRKYGLKQTTILKILKKYSKMHNELNTYLSNLHFKIATKYDMGIATRIENALTRYAKRNNIFNLEELMSDALNEKSNVRGFGARCREILKEFYIV